MPIETWLIMRDAMAFFGPQTMPSGPRAPEFIEFAVSSSLC